MFKLFCSFLVFTLCMSGMTQGSLEFEQVLFVEISAPTILDDIVWKVQRVLPSKAFAIDQPYSIEVNSEPIFVSNSNAVVKYWDNISSIHFEMRYRTEAGAGIGSCRVRLNFSLSESENGLPFGNRSQSGGLITAAQSTFASQFTVIPQVGTELIINTFRLWTSSNGSCQIPTKIRMTLSYTYGSTQVAECDGGGCFGNSTLDILGTSASPFTVAAARRYYFFAPATFPIGLPA